mmetsp:Transcript_5946/g.8775  ORF Transcript_5946/g.8775 Transcript_5946/m.8775 type:complete len:247 (+) Transcript_5946:1549-2289(+)
MRVLVAKVFCYQIKLLIAMTLMRILMHVMVIKLLSKSELNFLNILNLVMMDVYRVKILNSIFLHYRPTSLMMLVLTQYFLTSGTSILPMRSEDSFQKRRKKYVFKLRLPTAGVLLMILMILPIFVMPRVDSLKKRHYVVSNFTKVLMLSVLKKFPRIKATWKTILQSSFIHWPIHFLKVMRNIRIETIIMTTTVYPRQKMNWLRPPVREVIVLFLMYPKNYLNHLHHSTWLLLVLVLLNSCEIVVN